MRRGDNIPPISDYAHWNEEAASMWYAENRYDMAHADEPLHDDDLYGDEPVYEEDQEEGDWQYGNVDDCPTHGPEQYVTSSYATRGSDPYNINVLECGHHVICMGPGEDNMIVEV